MFPLVNHCKPQIPQRAHHFGFWSVNGEFGHNRSHHRLGNKSIHSGIFQFQRFASKGFDVKADGALDIMQGFVEGVAFAHNHALNACGIGHITVKDVFR